jgi:hypothetical protein
MSDHLDLDLDIGNYSIKDIERFFQLKPRLKYSAADIEQKEYQIREQLLASGHVSKRFKRDLIEFLTLAKDWLIHVKCRPFERQPTVIPKNYKLDNQDVPRLAEVPNRIDEIIQRPEVPYVNTLQSEFFPSNMNPLNTRIITKCLNIDTRFRDNIHSTSSSDFVVQLPDKFNKVVSMQLAALELPVSFYGISTSFGNNYFYITVNYQSINGDTTGADLPTFTVIENNDGTTTAYGAFIVPDGNYSASDLILQLNLTLRPINTDNTMLSPNNIFSYIQFTLPITQNGSGSGRVSIAPTSTPSGTTIFNSIKNNYSTTYSGNINYINLDFTLGQNGFFDGVDISSKLGWNLGFQQRQYLNKTNYIADTIIEPSNIRYLYLVVDDFHNNVNNHFVSAFNKSILGPNILARIPLKGASFSIMYENDYNTVSEPRRYFGPVDIQKLKIQLLDEYGKPVQMNNSDFSFCINLKMLYDL